MRLIVAPILILLLLSQTFQQWLVIGVFKVKQSWIATNTCENRYRPELKCNGNCVLMKKLRAQEKEEENAPLQLKLEVSTIIISSRSFFATYSPLYFTGIRPYFPADEAGRPVDRQQSFFHPPPAAFHVA